jgi:hypothetical protein
MESAANRNKGLVEQGNFRKAGQRIPLEQDNRLFPFTVSTFRESLMRAIKRAKLDEKNDLNRCRLHVHSCRKFFRNEAGRWGSPDTAEILMGHQPGLQSNYRKPSDEQLAADYRMAMPFISIDLPMKHGRHSPRKTPMPSLLLTYRKRTNS